MLLTLACIWGTAFLVTQIALRSVPPATLVASRIALAALVLSGTVALTRLPWPRDWHSWLYLLTLGMMGNAIPFFLVSWGQQRVSSSVTGLLMGVMPLTTFLLAHWCVAGERLTLRRLFGLVCGFAGLIVLLGAAAGNQLDNGQSLLLRQLAILLAACCYAANTILAGRLPKLPTLVMAAGSLLLGAVVMVPFAWAHDSYWPIRPNLPAILAVGWLGLVSTAFATIIYFTVIRRAGPTFLSLINYLIPVIALLAGIVWMGESTRATSFVGLVLILSGIALAQRRALPSD